MAADVFALIVLGCLGTPSVDTCQTKTIEFPHHLVTKQECDERFKALALTSASGTPVKVISHTCASLGALFGSAAPKLAENAAPPKAAPAPAPTPEPQDDATAPDGDGRSHI